MVMLVTEKGQLSHTKKTLLTLTHVHQQQALTFKHNEHSEFFFLFNDIQTDRLNVESYLWQDLQHPGLRLTGRRSGPTGIGNSGSGKIRMQLTVTKHFY